MGFTIDRIDHFVLNVRDVETAAAWYQRVLGMERAEYGPHRRTALKFGGQKINLRPVDSDPAAWPTATNDRPGAADVCFVSAVPTADVVSHLQDCGVAVAFGPIEQPGALGPMRSVYCRDPDGNLIEIASYLVD